MDDVITVQLDLEDKTLSFAKNNAPLVLAFENLPSVELQPVVVFHTSIHGGKVQIYDLVRLPKEQVLLSGTQCGNFMIFLSLRFYMKSILVILQVQNLPFQHI